MALYPGVPRLPPPEYPHEPSFAERGAVTDPALIKKGLEPGDTRLKKADEGVEVLGRLHAQFLAPFNAEPWAHLLRAHFVTPVKNFYVRSHGPVPLVDLSHYRLTIQGLVNKPLELSYSDILAMPKTTIMATLMCAGNRRNEMSKVRPVKGVGWDNQTLGNAVWTGVRLRHILQLAGVLSETLGAQHVEFAGMEPLNELKSDVYRVSIPIGKAMDECGDVIVAYEMNGEPLTRDHGFPLRMIVPGFIAARSVKWLDKIIVQSHECDGLFQQRDYKLFRPNVDWNNVEPLWNKFPAIQEMAVQSAITHPRDGALHPSGAPLVMQGYALNGGRRIVRVDVSIDGGENWDEAEIFTENTHPLNTYTEHRDWAWTFWEYRVKSCPSPCQLVCRAWDAAGNTQPTHVKDIWNLRGVMNTAYHRVTLNPASKI